MKYVVVTDKLSALLLVAALTSPCLTLAQYRTAQTGIQDSGKAATTEESDRYDRIKGTFPMIRKAFEKHVQENHLPSIVYGLVVDGDLVLAEWAGMANLDKAVPVSQSSMFRIASLSKSFTSMAILSLRDAGKLNLDDPAFLYIPELEGQHYPTSDSTHMTIRQLMTHSAGLPEDNPWADRQLADSDSELLRLLDGKISFSNPPGIAFEYSNLGYALLGKIITSVSGMRFQEYVRKAIWEPLGMESTTYEFADVDQDHLVRGYRLENGQLREEVMEHDGDDGSWGAMGGVITSLEEFARYMAFHLSAWPPRSTPDNGPIKRSSVREMHQPWRLDSLDTTALDTKGEVCATVTAYGYGLEWMRDCQGKTFINHGGGLPGFAANWNILPEYGVGIVSFTNLTYAPLRDLNVYLLNSIVEQANLEPLPVPVSPILEQRKGELLSVLPEWVGVGESELFAENFFLDHSLQSVKSQTEELFVKIGRITGASAMQQENWLRGSFTLYGEAGQVDVTFTLSPENPPRIQQLDFGEVRSIEPVGTYQ